MRYSKAGLGITVQMLFQFISYFGSFNLSRGKKPNEEISYFLSRTQHKNKAVWTQSKSTQLQAARWLQGRFVGSPSPGAGGRGPFWRARTLLEDVPVPQAHCPAERSGLGLRHLLSRCLQGLFHLEEDLETLFLPTYGVLSTALAALWTRGAVGAHSGTALRGLPQRGRYPGGHDTACSPCPH